MFFSYSDEKETVELDKKQKLTEKPDLNDVMNIVAAKIPGKWEMVSASINTCITCNGRECLCGCVCAHVCVCIQVGDHLGISKGELAGIARKRQDNDIECWRDVIVMWRNKASTRYPYRWFTIIEALESPEVDENELADGYCTELQELHKLNSKGDVAVYNTLIISS